MMTMSDADAFSVSPLFDLYKLSSLNVTLFVHMDFIHNLCFPCKSESFEPFLSLLPFLSVPTQAVKMNPGGKRERERCRLISREKTC